MFRKSASLLFFLAVAPTGCWFSATDRLEGAPCAEDSACTPPLVCDELIGECVESAGADLVLVKNGVTTHIDLGHARAQRGCSVLVPHPDRIQTLIQHALQIGGEVVAVGEGFVHGCRRVCSHPNSHQLQKGERSHRESEGIHGTVGHFEFGSFVDGPRAR